MILLSNHLLTLGESIVNWKAGDWAMWIGDTRHFAANIGIEYRYTLQITGHK